MRQQYNACTEDLKQYSKEFYNQRYGYDEMDLDKLSFKLLKIAEFLEEFRDQIDE